MHPVIGLQAPHQLSVADVDCDNFLRTTRQQNIGEPTGGCAGVEATATFDRQSFGTEGVECADQFVSTSRRPRNFLLHLDDPKWRSGFDRRRRLGRNGSRDENSPGGNQFLRMIS